MAKDAEKALFETTMAEFSKAHNFIMGGLKNYLWCKFIGDDGTEQSVAKAIATVKEAWSHRLIPVYGIDGSGQDIKLKPMNPVDVFIKGLDTGASKCGTWEPAKRWENLTFRPNEETEKSYNIFNGFPVIPKEGDIFLFIDIMERSFGKEECGNMMDWFAHMYQKPEEKILWAVIVKGEQGTGKNTMEEMLGRKLLRTENYFRSAQKDQLFGKFNAHLDSNLLVVGQEIMWGGDHKHDSEIKNLITEETRVIERKGIDAVPLTNLSRLYMTSNAEWVVPAGDGGIRRWYVVETAATGVISKDEWTKLYKWYANGGQEALMYEMLNRDIEIISLFSAKEAPPKTKALEEQMKHSLNDTEKFVLGIIENSYYTSYDRGEILTHYIKDDEQVISAKDFFEAFKSDKSNNVFRLNANSFGKAVKKILEYSTIRRSSGNHYVFHTRTQCRGNFYKNVGVEPELHESELKWVKKPSVFEENKLNKSEKEELLEDKKQKKYGKTA